METFWELRGGGDLASYQAALREREAISIKWQVFLDTHPLILMPSCAEQFLPVGIDTQGADGVKRMLNALKYQLAIPVLGLPSLAVPMGTARRPAERHPNRHPKIPRRPLPRRR